jgi:hypothetical protein
MVRGMAEAVIVRETAPCGRRPKRPPPSIAHAGYWSIVSAKLNMSNKSPIAGVLTGT